MALVADGAAQHGVQVGQLLLGLRGAPTVLALQPHHPPLQRLQIHAGLGFRVLESSLADSELLGATGFSAGPH